MRMIVFFDLPVETTEDRRQYRKFRKGLIKNGFMMMQESVYCRLVLNASIQRSVTEAIYRIRPRSGVVQLLTVTEKQFSNMQFITGESTNEILDTDERVVIL